MCLFCRLKSPFTAGKIKTSISVFTCTEVMRTELLKKACLTEWCSLNLFSPSDGWVILYTINPSIFQLLMETFLVGGAVGSGADFKNCQVAECDLA